MAQSHDAAVFGLWGCGRGSRSGFCLGSYRLWGRSGRRSGCGLLGRWGRRLFPTSGAGYTQQHCSGDKGSKDEHDQAVSLVGHLSTSYILPT
jgi:hypothetical protein